jgi:hypothetical protein
MNWWCEQMIRLLLSLLLGLLVQVAAASAGAEIKWRIHNPFRLFLDPNDTAAHREGYAAYNAWLERASQAEKERFAADGKGPIYFAEINHFAARHAPGESQLPYLKKLKSKPNDPYRGWAEAIVGKNRNKTCFDQGSQQYSACEKGGSQAKNFRGGSYIDPKFHEIEAWIEGAADLPGDCIWTRGQANGTASTDFPAQPCKANMRFDVPFQTKSSISVRRVGSPPGESIAKDEHVEVKDVLVVGLGDSFASGDGNPDSPIRLSSNLYNNYEAYLTTHDGDGKDWCLDLAKGKTSSVAPKSCGRSGINYPLGGYPARVGSPSSHEDNDGSFYTRDRYFVSKAFRDTQSSWLSVACHRSLYSHQVRVALQLALEDDHRAVTFLGYACTGAEVLGGLLLPEVFHTQREHEEKRRIASSQLSALSQDLCRTSSNATTAEPSSLSDELGDLYSAALFDSSKSKAEDLFKHWHDASVFKCKDRKRQVDLVLLSFGGNDIGFVPMIGHIVAGHDMDVGRWAEKVFKVFYNADQSRVRLGMLGARYQAADTALQKILGLKDDERSRILLPAYPEMANDENGALCSGGYFAEGKQLTPAAQGMDVHPLFRFNKAAAEGIQHYTPKEFYESMRKAAQAWTFVDRHVAAFSRHGVCASAKLPPDAPKERVDAENMRMPRCVRGRDGKCRPDWEWSQYEPDRFSPYASRERWFRTLNDAYLIDHFHSAPDAGVINQKASWQLAAAAAYSGAFHPSAEGQAIVADAMLQQARCVLYKNGRVSALGQASLLYKGCKRD